MFNPTQNVLATVRKQFQASVPPCSVPSADKAVAMPSPGRRAFLSAAAGTLGALAAGCGRYRSRESKSRPNILLALADDLSWLHTEAMGDRVVRTPNFDRLAREGVLFTQAFTACPSCTPSRSAILTGREIWQLEEGGLLHSTFNPRYVPYTHQLEAAGYHTGYTGKGWAPGTWDAGGLKRNPTGQEFNKRTLAAAPHDGLSKNDYAANFEDFLAARPPGAPFCFWFGSFEPHRDYQDGSGVRSGKTLAQAPVPPFLPASDVVRGDILDYCAEVDYFDQQLGRLIAVLEKSGELDDTLIVATSDNGMPFPRAKANLYDWGVRMPLAIRWPGRVRGLRVVDDLVGHIDLAPTFLEAAGLPISPQITGRSLMPILTGTAHAAREAIYTGMERHTWCRPEGATYPMRAIRTHDFLYIRNFAPDRWPGGNPDFVSSNRTFFGDVDAGPTKKFMEQHATGEFADLFQMAFGKRPEEELYDLATDPAQMRNVAADPAYSASRDKLRSSLEAYLKQTGDPRIAKRDPWQAYVYYQTEGYGASFNRTLSDEVRRKAREKGSRPE